MSLATQAATAALTAQGLAGPMGPVGGYAVESQTLQTEAARAAKNATLAPECPLRWETYVCVDVRVLALEVLAALTQDSPAQAARLAEYPAAIPTLISALLARDADDGGGAQAAAAGSAAATPAALATAAASSATSRNAATILVQLAGIQACRPSLLAAVPRLLHAAASDDIIADIYFNHLAVA